MRILRLVSLFVVAVLILGACSSDDDGGEAEAAAPEPTASESATPEATADAIETSEPEAIPTQEAADEPEYGGSLTYLLEAETDTWDIPQANCAVSCITVMRAVADPLMIVDAEGGYEPFLLASLEGNDDFTEWTLVMRDGVKFHDGTPVDGAALQRNFQEHATGVVQAQLFQDLENGIDSIELIDEMTVRLTYARPISVFPAYISDRVGGWLMAPAFWDDPDRASAPPISTGPFQMVDWVRDERTVLERNDDYWRTDAAGGALPYLDEVVFRPNPDASARLATMEAGDAEMNMDSNSENAEFWRTTWVENGGGLAEHDPARETTYLLLNSGSAPFDNPEMRRALALCTDREEYITFRAPTTEVSNGPFAEGDAGFLADTGFPEFDPAAGSALWDQIGRPDAIVYNYQQTPSNALTAELLADQWRNHCGLNVAPEGVDQSELITRAFTGAFQVIHFRNHGQGNPGVEYQWWQSRHTEGLALNFGRIIDPAMDELLDQTWATADSEELDELGQEISRLFGEAVYNIWLNWTEWEIAYADGVRNVGGMTLESGLPPQDTLAGRVWLHEAWLEG
jgi:peptide/nickel transport system substrate-binding protein